MRQITQNEGRVISFLFEQAGLDYDLERLCVDPMNDGGMGSLRFISETTTAEHRFGRKAAECFFNDLDGVLVIATLNLDQNDELFELDSWKVDFSPLISWPDSTHIRDTPEPEVS